MGQEKFKMSLEHFMMPESKEEFKGRQRHVERAQVPPQRAPNGQTGTIEQQNK